LILLWLALEHPNLWQQIRLMQAWQLTEELNYHSGRGTKFLFTHLVDGRTHYLVIHMHMAAKVFISLLVAKLLQAVG
jgi:hypothetical protein